MKGREYMRKLIFIADGQISNRDNSKYDKYIGFANEIGDERFAVQGDYYTHKDFVEYVKKIQPQGVVFDFDTQDEFDFIIDLLSDFVKHLHISAKHNQKFDFTVLEKCAMLETIQLYWNTKQDSLWDVKKNPKLKSFEITDYYQVSDFSAFRGSSIETLCLFGCNGLSSFTSKMHISDFSFVTDMPCLKELRIDIIKDEPSEYYLNLISKCENLEIFTAPDSFFTFQQFAWLRAKMPQIKQGLDCVCKYGDNLYAIIGKRTPKMLDDFEKTKKYQSRYDLLIKKYLAIQDPPSDQEKD